MMNADKEAFGDAAKYDGAVTAYEGRLRALVGEARRPPEKDEQMTMRDAGLVETDAPEPLFGWQAMNDGMAMNGGAEA